MKSLLGTLFDKSPIPFPTRGSGLGGSAYGVGGSSSPEAMMRAYGTVSTLFAIVDRLATSVSKPDWHLMRKGTETEVTSHPCIDLWNNPNPFYTQNDFIEAVQQHMDLVGEQWWIVGRSKLGVGPPLELWPVRPDKMNPVPDPEAFISGYVYSNGGEKVPLTAQEVIWTKKQNPLDPYRGIGPVQTILTDLDSDKYSAAWNANFFRNNALPGGVIEVDAHLDDQQFEELVLRWREQHQGVANAHRVAILEKAHFQEMKYTQRDMQFQQLRQMTQEIIAMAFGFPMHMLGVTKDVNRANAETQEIMYQRWLVVPRLERIKQLLNTKLLPMFGEGQADQYEWVYDDPTPEDKKGDAEVLAAAATAVKTFIDAGFDPSDVLEACHIEPMKRAETPPPPALAAPGPVQQPGQAPPPGQAHPNPDQPQNVAELHALLNKVKHVSYEQAGRKWAQRLDKQGSALERFLEERWED